MPDRARTREVLTAVEGVCPLCGKTSTLTTYRSWLPGRLGVGRRDVRERVECNRCGMRWDRDRSLPRSSPA